MLFLAVVKDLPRSKFSLLCKLLIRGSRGEISMMERKYLNIQPPIGLYRLCLATLSNFSSLEQPEATLVYSINLLKFA